VRISVYTAAVKVTLIHRKKHREYRELFITQTHTHTVKNAFSNYVVC